MTLPPLHRFIADLHIHSHLSRATSRDLTIPGLVAWAQRKGIGLVGTGDFTHPEWLGEIRRTLEEDGTGFLVPRAAVRDEVSRDLPRAVHGDVRFVLSVEISSIFRKGDRVRKVHTVVFVPSLAAAERFQIALSRLGNVTSDGRPILGLEPLRILQVARDASSDAFVIPAHVWTPHFSIFGAQSGFDALEECFEDLSGEVFALETGLSSDPAMNRRWSALDRFALVSSSDAHSPSKLGREATVFEGERSWAGMVAALKAGGRRMAGACNHGVVRGGTRLAGTIEFFPEEGKYHVDGHRKCSFRCEPDETRRLGGRCPVCGGKLTPGVLGRVDALADRASADVPTAEFPPQWSLFPLPEVLGEILGTGPASKRVDEAYARILAEFGPELPLLNWGSTDDLDGEGQGLLAEALRRMRAGRVHLDPGYDGEYGHVGVFNPGEVAVLKGQGLLFGPSGAATAARPAKRPATASAPDSPFEAGGPDVPSVRIAPDGLTDEQRLAATAGDGPIALIAGPGTGKTRTLVARAAHLLQSGVPASSVLVVTFTQRAAGEAAARLEATGCQGVKALTFHAFALSELSRMALAEGLEAPRPIGRDEALRILRSVAGADATRLLDAIARGRTALEDVPIIHRYRAALAESGCIDLDGIVPALVARLGSDPAAVGALSARLRYVLVDEFQDIGADQYALLDLLRPGGVGIFAVGDPDQSIYGFRGADAGVFERFAADHPDTRVLRLTASFRATPEVAALAAVARGTSTAGPGAGSAANLVPMRAGGRRVTLYAARDVHDEAAWIRDAIRDLLGGLEMHTSTAERGTIGLGDIAVLGRTHAVLEPVAKALAESGIPFERASDRPLWDTPWVAAVLDALGQAAPDSLAAEVASTALDAAGLSVSRREINALLRLASGCDAPSAFARLATLREVDAFGLDPERVHLLTLHASKGLEFESVFIAGCQDGVLPPARVPGRDAPDLDEERRLLFVGITRSGGRLGLGWVRGNGPFAGRTPFLERLPADAVEQASESRRRAPKPIQQTLL